ncbi:MAG: 23S rRNA (guanosine(2251)-2'-O)-methyltransferase RlmB [Proteobacteria bacterium]|nr:23S rRNA (guanosine(2251)-2'-O)-methyltransferase RlmB [Pseudomonadota bacterium]NIS69227.1 23S rRNA (guanosine(2251)-2'-O)-methyltransferase RlmB [Pseudomonadota bacterium]
MDQVIYGINPVIEALQVPQTEIKEILIAHGRNRKIGQIVGLAEKQQIQIRYRERNELSTIAKSRFHQGVVAVVEDYRYATVEEIIGKWKKSGSKALILVLDSIQDPQNLGACIRTANVCGAHGVIIPKDRAAKITPAVVKASAGATALTSVVRITNISSTLKRLKQEGIWIVGTAGGAEKSLYQQDLTEDLAVVIGSEGRGIRPLVLRNCDLIVSIPMSGEISSLNASVAAGIVLYEIVRQRLMKRNFI